MVLTPTYYVFELYREHQDAERIESYVQQDLTGTEEAQVPALSVSASRDVNGDVHATVVNLDADKKQTLHCRLTGGNCTKADIRYISGAMDAHNEFGMEPQVQIHENRDLEICGQTLNVEMPPCCVMQISLRQ